LGKKSCCVYRRLIVLAIRNSKILDSILPAVQDIRAATIDAPRRAFPCGQTEDEQAPMRITIIFVVAMASVLALGSASMLRTQADTGASIVELPRLPGTDTANAVAINSTGGFATGSSCRSPCGADGHGSYGLRWTGTTQVPLGLIPGGVFSVSAGINSSGSIVVGKVTYEPTVVHYQAFRWVQTSPSSGQMVGLGFAQGDTDSNAAAVSTDGSTVVGSSWGTTHGMSAAIWTPSGNMQRLPMLKGTSGDEVAIGISSDGLVIVGSISDSRAQTGIVWLGLNRDAQGLGLLPNDTGNSAAAVSANGLVIVGQSSSQNSTQAVRWSQAGIPEALGLPASGSRPASWAAAVNDNGTVIVGNSTDGPFRWTAIDKFQSLKTLLMRAGVDVSNWVLGWATGVSADGTVIVGYGTVRISNSDTHQGAYLIKLPLPPGAYQAVMPQRRI
jgi:uncharacterized membrane protein